MNELEGLIAISRYYGANSDFVIAGGGNTSYKTEESLYIKASGIALSNIDEYGFVKISRAKLGIMGDKAYPIDVVKREAAVKRDLADAIISPKHLRPSVETSLHDLINYAYVVHTHPTLVNGLMCSNDAEPELRRMFGDEALYMGYTDPGFILFKELQAKVRDYESSFQQAPKIIFLQNHGIFVAANSTEEIKALYNSIMQRIGDGKDVSLPDETVSEWQSPVVSVLSDIFLKRTLLVKAVRSPLVEFFTDRRDRFNRIIRPFTPDIIVYCKSNYLFLEKGLDAGGIEDRLSEFESTHGYLPKVIIEEEGGLIALEESDKSLQTVLEVFQDMMKISYLSEQFGGPHFMTDEQISFIDNWEVENYRRSVARKE